MRLVTKAALGLIGLCAAGVLGTLGYLRFAKPVVRPPSTEVIERTPERLARGTYLVEHLLPCLHCHSEHDRTHFDMPITGGAGAGGFVFDRTLGLPGSVQPPNITPDPETGIGKHTDGELLRAIREGIGKDGRALFPMMPYPTFRQMSDEDVRAVIVYLRALPPVTKKSAPVEIDFPVSYFIRSVPAPVEQPVSAPDRANTVAYGGYLVKMADCHACHTPIDKRGQPIAGRDFAGGREFALTWEDGKLGPRVVSANITSDVTGFFGRATKEQWIARVKVNAALEKAPPETPLARNTLMPWIAFSGLTDEDLGAIYDYMKTVPPITNTVQTFPDAL